MSLWTDVQRNRMTQPRLHNPADRPPRTEELVHALDLDLERPASRTGGIMLAIGTAHSTAFCRSSLG